MITDRDVRYQIVESLDANADDFDVDAITDEFIRRWGLVHIDTAPAADYWALVQEHG
jgi:hypothetical protein